MIRATAMGAVLFLTACGGPGDSAADQPVEVPGSENVQAALETMPEGQRNAVFIRAIQDANQECQHVERSARAGEHQGFPVWTAYCAGGAEYTIVIQNDGTASVLNAAEARLAGSNEATPANAQ